MGRVHHLRKGHTSSIENVAIAEVIVVLVVAAENEEFGVAEGGDEGVDSGGEVFGFGLDLAPLHWLAVKQRLSVQVPDAAQPNHVSRLRDGHSAEDVDRVLD